MFCALCLSVKEILLRERSAACQPADYIKPPRKIGLLRNRKVVGSFYNGNVCLGILFGQGLDHLQRKGGIDNRVLAANHRPYRQTAQLGDIFCAGLYAAAQRRNRTK